LRSRPLSAPLHVALVEPEIPPNTGNIARLCAATGTPLHLVGTLGFRVDDHAVRRAGIDYWHLVDLYRHLDLAHLRNALPDARWVLFSASAEQSYLDAEFRPGDVLLFGRESVGLPDDLLARHPGSVFGIPTLGPVRSLNLANAVAIVLYEALRQAGALSATFMG
jgi:tRNA (cytidine/uridine-2'-O-)-methyltransferase